MTNAPCGPLLTPLEPDERLSAEDMAARRADEFLAHALRAQAQAASAQPAVRRGVCLDCGDTCHPSTMYCDNECRASHERALAARARRGAA